MADELSISFSVSYNKNGVGETKSFIGNITVAGKTPLATVQTIGTGDETLSLGDTTTPGFLFMKNQAALVSVTTPAAPTIAIQGSAGSTTISYKIVAKQTDGSYSAASSAGTTTTANATLTGSNFPRLTWVDQAAATGGYDIYRTAAGGTPSTVGKIGSVAAGVITFDDTGLAGDAGTAPSVAIDNVILIGADGSSYPNRLKGGEPGFVRWNGAAIHAKANTVAADLEYLLLPD
jgi:hypothetical protein